MRSRGTGNDNLSRNLLNGNYAGQVQGKGSKAVATSQFAGTPMEMYISLLPLSRLV